ncbi:MAG TPA: alpha/beta hydrolase [Cellvibrio sp.]|nr:alpha/beta hydrolase [Cellvibrio sp.]
MKSFFIALLLTTICGCASKQTLTLIPTPVLYDQSKINPFAHLKSDKKSTYNSIHFATIRAPMEEQGNLTYGNEISDQLHMGRAQVQIGDDSMQWAELEQDSLRSIRTKSIPLSLTTITEVAQLPQPDAAKNKQLPQTLTPEQQKFVDEINTELADALDKEIMLYVHGTKAAFTNAAFIAAEMDHFSGRDFVSIFFSWPSHQNIFSYLVGTDVHRAKDASQSLSMFIEFLATHTTAKRINILSYSAGARTTSKAIYEMAQTTHARNTYKLGSVIYAAADVPIDTFLERLPASSALAEKVVLTVTDDDNVLRAAERFMRGRARAGSTEAEVEEENFIAQTHLTNVEIIDVSLGKSTRGFDITGHRYWYLHPWISSDIIFLLRTDLPASRRGLSPAEIAGVWYLAADYPQKVTTAVDRELKAQWQPKD